jgi:hypothetical protein
MCHKGTKRQKASCDFLHRNSVPMWLRFGRNCTKQNEEISRCRTTHRELCDQLTTFRCGPRPASRLENFLRIKLQSSAPVELDPPVRPLGDASLAANGLHCSYGNILPRYIRVRHGEILAMFQCCPLSVWVCVCLFVCARACVCARVCARVCLRYVRPQRIGEAKGEGHTSFAAASLSLML